MVSCSSCPHYWSCVASFDWLVAIWWNLSVLLLKWIHQVIGVITETESIWSFLSLSKRESLFWFCLHNLKKLKWLDDFIVPMEFYSCELSHLTDQLCVFFKHNHLTDLRSFDNLKVKFFVLFSILFMVYIVCKCFYNKGCLLFLHVRMHVLDRILSSYPFFYWI